MDHDDAVRRKATERYLLNELDPDQRDQFEEHLFDCADCALDVRAAAMFLEQSKNALRDTPNGAKAPVPAPVKGWLAWLRPAFVVPTLAVLVAVIGYQNVVELPSMKHAMALPQVMPSVSLDVATRGANIPSLPLQTGQAFSAHVDLPPNSGYSSYIVDLYNPAGHIEWSLTVPAQAVVNDSLAIRVPGTQRPAGTYILAVRGVSQAGNSPSEIGRQPFEVRLQ
jgi:hypothetical protein